jgi:hypothetical protein
MDQLSGKKLKKERKKQSMMLLVIVDIYSQWTEIIPARSISSTTMIKAIEKYWKANFLTPESILSDNGRQFIQRNLRLMKCGKTLD